MEEAMFTRAFLSMLELWAEADSKQKNLTRKEWEEMKTFFQDFIK